MTINENIISFAQFVPTQSYHCFVVITWDCNHGDFKHQAGHKIWLVDHSGLGCPNLHRCELWIAVSRFLNMSSFLPHYCSLIRVSCLLFPFICSSSLMQLYAFTFLPLSLLLCIIFSFIFFLSIFFFLSFFPSAVSCWHYSAEDST